MPTAGKHGKRNTKKRKRASRDARNPGKKRRPTPIDGNKPARIEEIFEEVVGREMDSEERKMLLKRRHPRRPA